ncbi:MAG: hypothetical protein HKO90_01445 [Flavobacteriaceae bacterium]|nr:hypothetical protein [Flavobacteriaceae bacterium]
MDKIESTLLKKINQNLSEEFKVLICTTIDSSFRNYNGWKELMEGIYSVRLTGSQIKELAKNKNVLSIETDVEMKIIEDPD